MLVGQRTYLRGNYLSNMSSYASTASSYSPSNTNLPWSNTKPLSQKSSALLGECVTYSTVT
jgi:hypothetical protein